jgi:hypothetical protein
LLSLLPGLGCATGEGWQRTDARTCESAAPARLCVAAEPDRGLVMRLGELALVPGECADAPAERAGSSARVEIELEDGRIRRRGVRLPRGRVTTVTVDAGGRARVSRDRCTVSPGADD